MSSVTIIGGGLAGLSSAVFLKEKGFNVRLIESSSKLGGRASSYFDKKVNMYFDNGQHIFAGWYENTFEYLKLIGSFDKLLFQKSLNVKFINSNRNLFELKASDLPVPLNILSGLLFYKALKLIDKIKIIKLILFVRRNINNPVFDRLNLNDIFKIIPQTKNGANYFWVPLISAIFNSIPEHVSFEVFKNLINIALKKKTYSSLVLPSEDLYNTFVKGAEDYFKKNNVEVFESCKCKQLRISNRKVEFALLPDGKRISSDYYILAVPFYSFRDFFPVELVKEYFPAYKDLKASSVISIHLIFEKPILPDVIPFNEFGMLGVNCKTIQWIFWKAPNIISLTISAIDFSENLKNKRNDEIYDLCLNDLYFLFDGLKNNRVTKYKLIRERRATFLSDSNSTDGRINANTIIKNLFVAGDWVNTGLPSTIESAIKSSKMISEIIEKN